MPPNDKKRHNPLVLDDDYEKLFDEDFLDFSELNEDSDIFEDLSNGSRRRKPLIDTDF